MKLISCLIAILVVATNVTEARIGETPKECDKRYGNPVYNTTEKKCAYRAYRFEGKTIRVFFYGEKAVKEMIQIDPISVHQTRDGGAAYGLNSIKLFRSILTVVYRFSDEQVASACELSFRSDGAAGGGTETPAIKAQYRIDSNERAGTVEFTMILTDNMILPMKPKDEDKATEKEFDNFLIDSLKKEQKAKDAKASNGF